MENKLNHDVRYKKCIEGVMNTVENLDDVLNLRCVSSDWNAGFQLSKFPKTRLAMTLEGTPGQNDFSTRSEQQIAVVKERHEKQIETIASNGSVWKSWMFKYLSFAQEFNLNGPIFKFIKDSKPMSMSFVHCEIKMEEFLFMISELVGLQELQVLGCLGMWRAGHDIIESVMFMRPFIRNLSNLKKLEVYHTEEEDIRQSIETWLHDTYQLKSLILRIEAGPQTFGCALLRALGRNQITLKTLYLTCHTLSPAQLKALISDKLPQLQLHYLTLVQVKFDIPDRFKQFLEGQTSLKTLHMGTMLIPGSLFPSMSLHHALTRIQLIEVSLESSSLEWLQKSDYAPPNLVDFELTLRGDGIDKSLADLQFTITQMEEPNKSIENLTLRPVDLESDPSGIEGYGIIGTIVNSIGEKFPGLISLNLANTLGLTKDCLGGLWTLPKIKYLSLRSCCLTDRELGERSSIRDLTKLECLDLGGNSIGDEILYLSLSPLIALRCLDLHGTNVTYEGIKSFLSKRDTFDSLYLGWCHEANVPRTELEEFKALLNKLGCHCQYAVDDSQGQNGGSGDEEDDSSSWEDVDSDDDEEKEQIPDGTFIKEEPRYKWDGPVYDV